MYMYIHIKLVLNAGSGIVRKVLVHFLLCISYSVTMPGFTGFPLIWKIWKFVNLENSWNFMLEDLEFLV